MTSPLLFILQHPVQILQLFLVSQNDEALVRRQDGFRRGIDVVVPVFVAVADDIDAGAGAQVQIAHGNMPTGSRQVFESNFLKANVRLILSGDERKELHRSGFADQSSHVKTADLLRHHYMIGACHHQFFFGAGVHCPADDVDFGS